MRHVPVLVVGGSLTGLSAALFLGMHAVPALVVERRGSILAHPRLRGLLPRAVELYRQAGLEEEITAIYPSNPPTEQLVSVHAATLADEHEILGETAGAKDTGNTGNTGNTGDTEETAEPLSPCSFVPIGQHELESLLAERIRAQGAELCFGTELTGWEQDPDGVTARLRGPDGATRTVRARYLIAADGASSGIRRRLGIGTVGPGTLFRMATMHIRADLSPALRGRPVGMAYLDRPAAGTTLGPLDSTGLHWFFATAVPAGARRPDPVAWVRAATGLPDLEVRLLDQLPGGGEQVFTFPVGARVAERYAQGRVFLAGDAAHLMPPTGTLGGLTCIEDAHNLAWKLALVLRREAGPGLLDSYAAERRPVAERNMRQAYARALARWRLPGRTMDEPLLDTDTLMYGFRYRSPAAGSAGNGAPEPGAPHPLPAAPDGLPGTRAPHLSVSQDAAAPMSTLDLYGSRLVLLVGPEADAWAAAARRAGRLLSVPVEVYHLDGELAEPHGLGAFGALLVRPDGHVAWRASDAGADPDRDFERVLRAVLAR
ncbi:FAD-dependent monooxygenase [Streptomyces palmae]|uniref:Monooxygenase n=1 Tax=Streptomyces palmae TaxID=1701085 RepID=A0A4Z0H988_9ACTN|nr:FAD-dependent monooxygenase [Streptomyces palmae]TGB13673.1 monooxygenase [Streptomyces palmae]